MIKLNEAGSNGHTHYVQPSHITRISTASANSQWYGIKAFVHLESGTVLEVRETAEWILKQVEEAASHNLALQQTGVSK